METKNNKTIPPAVVQGFDAVKTMRELRDKLSIEIMNMTYEEERLYLDKLLSAKQNKK